MRERLHAAPNRAMGRSVIGIPPRSECIRVRTARVSVRLWRCEAGVPQGLFTFAGAADDAVLAAVMEHVRHLTAALPDWWRLEVITVGLRGRSLHEMRRMVRDLQPGSLSHGARPLQRRGRVRGGARVRSQSGLVPTLPH